MTDPVRLVDVPRSITCTQEQCVQAHVDGRVYLIQPTHPYKPIAWVYEGKTKDLIGSIVCFAGHIQADCHGLHYRDDKYQVQDDVRQIAMAYFEREGYTGCKFMPSR